MSNSNKDMIVKSNTLINASHSLSLAEQKLIALAIIEAREIKMPVTDKVMLEVRAIDYAKMFAVSNETAYETLKTAVDKLFERHFEYEMFLIPSDGDQPAHFTNVPSVKAKDPDGFSARVKGRWVEKVGYSQGAVYIQFSSELIPFVTDLKTYFTKYYLSQTVNFTSSYANRLFELISSWKSKRKTPIYSIEDLRGKLGVEEGQYKNMNDFKKRVLEVAVDQVSQGEFIVSYKQHKEGRKIVAFSFTMKKNPKHKPPTKELAELTETAENSHTQWVTGMSDKQIETFGALLAHDSKFNTSTFEAPRGMEMHEYVQLVKQCLREPTNQIKWSVDLKRVGFKIGGKKQG